jgi:hypothetical protein
MMANCSTVGWVDKPSIFAIVMVTAGFRSSIQPTALGQQKAAPLGKRDRVLQ